MADFQKLEKRPKVISVVRLGLGRFGIAPMPDFQKLELKPEMIPPLYVTFSKIQRMFVSKQIMLN